MSNERELTTGMDAEAWGAVWQEKIEHYLNAVPRTGVFIDRYFRGKVHTILEVAAGSSRDSIYLAKQGFHVTASDYERNIIQCMEERTHESRIRFVHADAFHMGMENDAFDLVFHNGFFVLFDENEAIVDLLREQARIARHYIVIFVHNALNHAHVSHFEKLAQSDPLYKIRFFEPDEVAAVVKQSGIAVRRLEWMKFGGPYDILFYKRMKKVIPNLLYPMRTWLVPRGYQRQRWDKTERVCCVIELDKGGCPGSPHGVPS